MSRYNNGSLLLVIFIAKAKKNIYLPESDLGILRENQIVFSLLKLCTT